MRINLSVCLELRASEQVCQSWLVGEITWDKAIMSNGERGCAFLIGGFQRILKFEEFWPETC